MKRLGKSFLQGLGGALIGFVVMLLVTQDVKRAVGTGVAAFLLFFVIGLFSGGGGSSSAK